MIKKMDDLISRQAAIEIAENELDGGTFYDIPMKLKYLPSVEPEIIYCKDCKWWEKNKSSLYGYCNYMRHYHSYDFFCANAEPREEE